MRQIRGDAHRGVPVALGTQWVEIAGWRKVVLGQTSVLPVRLTTPVWLQGARVLNVIGSFTPVWSMRAKVLATRFFAD